MNPSVLPSDLGKIVGQIGLSNSGRATSLREGKTLNEKPEEYCSGEICGTLVHHSSVNSSFKNFDQFYTSWEVPMA